MRDGNYVLLLLALPGGWGAGAGLFGKPIVKQPRCSMACASSPRSVIGCAAAASAGIVRTTDCRPEGREESTLRAQARVASNRLHGRRYLVAEPAGLQLAVVADAHSLHTHAIMPTPQKLWELEPPPEGPRCDSACRRACGFGPDCGLLLACGKQLIAMPVLAYSLFGPEGGPVPMVSGCSPHWLDEARLNSLSEARCWAWLQSCWLCGNTPAEPLRGV